MLHVGQVDWYLGSVGCSCQEANGPHFARQDESKYLLRLSMAPSQRKWLIHTSQSALKVEVNRKMGGRVQCMMEVGI